MKSILSGFILLVSITLLFSSCSSSEDEEYTSTASSGSGTSTTSLSSTVIAELKANLSSSSTSRSLDDTWGRLTRVSSRNTSKTLTNSLTAAHISSITTAAAAKVTAASLYSSEDLIALMPTIVEGAQGKISDLGISSAESIKVINVIVNSLVKSLDGKSAYIPITSAETDLTGNETVLKLITAKSVSQIDEAGLGASDVGSASSEIVETVIGSLGSSGIGSTELTGVVDQISGGAVEALDQITGFSVSSLGDAIDNITSGATSGLGDITLTGYSVSDLDEMVGSVTSGATAALGKISMTGYSSDNLSAMIKHVTAGATGGLGRISMTDYNTSHLPAMLRNITGGATGSLGRISMDGYSSDNLTTMVEKVTAGATGALGRISMTGYSSDNLSTMVREVTSGATGSLGRISMTGYDVNDLSTMIEKVTAGSTEALGDISMSGYDASDLTGMMENITAGATASLGFISMTGYSSDNLSFMVSKVTAGATGALGRISMTGYSSDNLSSMVEKVTAGATGALGRISMSGYDYNDLTGMMENIQSGTTGGLANISMSGYSSDNVSHLTTKIKSGGSGALGDIRMSGYDHNNPGSTYTNIINFGAGVSLMGGVIQGTALSLSTVVTTLAGTAGHSGFIDATGTNAKFSSPWAMTTDGTNLYVAESGRHIIRKVVISTGVVTILAGTTSGDYGSADGTGPSDDYPPSPGFYRPRSITTDGTNLYVGDSANSTIRKIVISSGVVTTPFGVAGTSGTTDATGTSALFDYPIGITTDGTNLYVTQGNHIIRKIVISSGVVTTPFGVAGTSGTTDATGTSARFNAPKGITTDGTNLYVAEYGNHTIRKIVISSGVVTTLAGSGSCGTSDGTGTSAEFCRPEKLTTDGTNIYVSDTGRQRIRKIVISSGVVTTLAGDGTARHRDATGTNAQFDSPRGITTDGTNLYISDTSSHAIRKME